MEFKYLPGFVLKSSRVNFQFTWDSHEVQLSYEKIEAHANPGI